MSRLFTVYVRCLFALHLSILTLAFLALINVVLNLGDFTPIIRRLPLGALLASIPAFLLAKSKNIWKSEFLQCPMWIRMGCVILMVYGLAAATLTTVLSQEPLFEADPLSRLRLFSLLFRCLW